MKIFILILLFQSSLYNTQVTSLEFSSLEKCKAAGDLAIEKSLATRAICVEK